MPSIGKSLGSTNSNRRECGKQSDELVSIDFAVPALCQTGDENPISEPPPLLISDSGKRALQCLVSRSVPQDELPSLIETVVSSAKAANIVQCLQGSDAQVFIDMVDQVCGAATSQRNGFTANPSLVSRWEPSISHHRSAENA